jgi:hypothetical protein
MKEILNGDEKEGNLGNETVPENLEELLNFIMVKKKISSISMPIALSIFRS